MSLPRLSPLPPPLSTSLASVGDLPRKLATAPSLLAVCRGIEEAPGLSHGQADDDTISTLSVGHSDHPPRHLAPPARRSRHGLDGAGEARIRVGDARAGRAKVDPNGALKRGVAEAGPVPAARQ